MAKRRWIGWAAVAILALLSATVLNGGQEARLASAQDEGLELAVYNQNLALVKDPRRLDLSPGLNEVRFGDVAALIDPTSVHFRSLTDPDGTIVLEQNYEYDIVNSAKILNKYVDMEIGLVTEDGQEYRGTLLSGQGDVILESDDGQLTVIKLDRVKEFSFPALPEGLITKPTLVWHLDSSEGGGQEVEVTYLTGGVNWQADYIIVLADDDGSIDLDGWVTLDNQSGTSFPNAKLKLIAGDIHRAPTNGYVVEKELAFGAADAAAPQVEERAFFEYHLYEIQRPVTVKNQQTKQIEFVTGSNVPAEKFFVYDGAQMRFSGYYQPVDDPSYGTASNKKVMIMLEFRNGEDEGLGVPLPKGKLRVYQKDTDGSTLLIGEDAIDHTPKDEQVRLYIGDAFDVVGERVQTDFKAEYDEDWMEESYEITLRNHKDEDIEVRVVEHMFRWSEWRILEESHEHIKTDSRTMEYHVPVEAGGETVVTYTVRYQW
jgi:hypothetical protein